MDHEKLEVVRNAVWQVLRARVAEFDPAALSESVLLRGSRYVGHQFVLGHVKLRWLIGEQKLWLHEDGQVPRAIDLTRPQSSQKAA